MKREFRLEEGRLLLNDQYDLGKYVYPRQLKWDWAQGKIVRIGAEHNFYTQPLYGQVTHPQEFFEHTNTPQPSYMRSMRQPLFLKFILPKNEDSISFYAQGGGLEFLNTPMLSNTIEGTLQQAQLHIFPQGAQLQPTAIAFSQPMNISYERHLLKRKAKQRRTTSRERARCAFYYEILQDYE